MGDFNPGQDLLAGQAYDQGIIHNTLVNAANNALVAKYGAAAGNPEAWQTAENTNYLQSLHPLLVQSQANNNTLTGVQAGIAKDTQASTTAATNAGNTSYVLNQPNVMATNAAAAAGAQADAQLKTTAAGAAVAAQHARAVATAATAMQNAITANPNDPEGAYKAGIAAGNLIAPGEGDAYAPNTPQGKLLHDNFIANPTATIQGLNNQVQSGIAGMLQTLTPAQQIELYKSNADFQKLVQDNREKKQTIYNTALENEKSILGSQGSIGAGLVSTDRALQNIQQMRSLLGNVSDNTTWNAAVNAHVPGSDMKQLEALAEGTGSALSVDMLAGAKQAGGSLGVRASNTEFKGIGEALMKIDPNMTVAQMKSQLDSAEQAVRAYKDGATGLLYGPNGPTELRNAQARRLQAEADLNKDFGVLRTPDGAAPAASSASPAASAPPSGAAGASPAAGVTGTGNPPPAGMVWDSKTESMVPASGAAAAPVPRIGGGVSAPQGAQPIGSFNAALTHTLGAEGGYNERDANGAPVNMGINAAAHPGEDIRGMTVARASQIYKSDYWDKIGGDELAKTNPGLAHAGFDIAVVDGADKAKQLMAQAGGDANKLIDLQQQFQNNLIAKDPSRYGKYADVWTKRNAALRSDVAQGYVGSSYASAGAPAGGAPGGPIQAIPVNMIPAQQPGAIESPSVAAARAAQQNAAPAAPAAPATPTPQPIPIQVGDNGQAAQLAAINDPTTGAVAKAFTGSRTQVMAGRALLAKYLGRTA